MKGYRTLLVNAVLAGGAAILTYLGSVDLSQYVSETWAVVLVAVINVGLRLVTTTKAGRSE